MNARQKAKKYKKELDILKNTSIQTKEVIHSVDDIVTYKAEVRISDNEIFKFGYSDDFISMMILNDRYNMLLDQFKDAIKDNTEFKVEECLYGKKIIACLRLVKPRRSNERRD